MIGSTRHSFKKLNKDKGSRLDAFVVEYDRICRIAIDVIWNNLPDNLVIAKYLDTSSYSNETCMSARALRCCIDQARDIVAGTIEKQKRRLYINEKYGKDLKSVYSKPEIKDVIFPQLSSLCLDFEFNKSKEFGGFIRLKSLGKTFGHIKIPIDDTKMYQKWSKNGTICNSIKIFKNHFQLAWRIEKTPRSQGDKIIGIDQGLKTVATLSDGQTTSDEDVHGHSLQSVIKKLSRKKKGSKCFRKAQTHRKNFVNWSINQLDFSNLKEVRLEKIVNIKKGVSTSRGMTHWSNPEIRDKIKRKLEELEVPVVEQSCAYRSQRCNQCGLVRKANRKGKVYSCSSCGFVGDADFNASKNHECNLQPIPFDFIGKGLNLGSGFFWKEEGLFKIDGSELIVPDTKKTNNIENFQ